MAMTKEEAHQSRLDGIPLRFAVKRRFSSLPGHTPVDERFPHLGTRETAVFGTVDWMVIDTHIMNFEVASFSTEDEAGEACDELNATRESGEHDLRTLVHPLKEG